MVNVFTTAAQRPAAVNARIAREYEVLIASLGGLHMLSTSERLEYEAAKQFSSERT